MSSSDASPAAGASPGAFCATSRKMAPPEPGAVDLIEHDLGTVQGGPHDGGAFEVRLTARRPHRYSTRVELVRAPVGGTPVSVARDLGQWRFALRAGSNDIPTTRTLEGALFATAFCRAVRRGLFQPPLIYAGTVALAPFDRHDPRLDLTGAVNVYSDPGADVVVLDPVPGRHHWPLSDVDDSRVFGDAEAATRALGAMLGADAVGPVMTDLGTPVARGVALAELPALLAVEIARRDPDWPLWRESGVTTEWP